MTEPVVHRHLRWAQLVAWLLFAVVVAIAFAVQGGNIDRDARTQHDACVGIVKNLDGIIEVAQVEVSEGDHIETARGEVAHRQLRLEVDKLEQSRADLLDSRLCESVRAADLTDD